MREGEKKIVVENGYACLRFLLGKKKHLGRKNGLGFFQLFFTLLLTW